MQIMTAKESRNAVQPTPLADQVILIDTHYTTQVHGAFLNFYDAFGLVGLVDSRTMTGQANAVPTQSMSRTVSADAFEIVALRMYRNMLARQAQKALMAAKGGN